VCGDASARGVVREIVGGLWPGQAEAVLELRGQRDAVIAVRCLLDEESAAKLARELFIELVDQLLAEQRLIAERGVASLGWRVKPALVQTVDEVEGCHVGIAAEIPTLVADIDAKRGALATKRPIAEVADTRRDQRAPIREDLFWRQTPDDVVRMIHQASPDHIAPVGHTPGGSAAVRRHQQQTRGLDRVRRDDEDLGLN